MGWEFILQLTAVTVAVGLAVGINDYYWRRHIEAECARRFGRR